MVGKGKQEETPVQIRIVVRAEWDEDACVWVATSDHVPGLVTESSSLDDLMRRCEQLIPDLLKMNGAAPDDDSRLAPFDLVAQRYRSNSLGC